MHSPKFYPKLKINYTRTHAQHKNTSTKLKGNRPKART